MSALSFLRRRSWILPLVGLVVILLLPTMGLQVYWRQQVLLIAIYTLIVSGLNLSWGYGGDSLWVANGCVADLSSSRVSQAVVRKFRVFQPGLYASADLQGGKLRYVRQSEGAIQETEETHAGGDALEAQAQAFLEAVQKRNPPAVDGVEGRRVLKLALDIGRLVRERLARFA